ncbi:acetyl-CoA synthetase, partial [Pseudoloma neurophilia]
NGRWPGMAQTILNDMDRFKRDYLQNGVYWTGDEGYCQIGVRRCSKYDSDSIHSIKEGTEKEDKEDKEKEGDKEDKEKEGDKDCLKEEKDIHSIKESIHYKRAPYFFVRGRADDVINVSGHRISTAEVESATNSHPSVVECAMVGQENALTGMGIVLFVVLQHKTGDQKSDDQKITSSGDDQKITSSGDDQKIKLEIKKHLRTVIGALINPDKIFIVDDIPKTRTGKIMRRVLKRMLTIKLENDMAALLGDTSTMGNRECLENIKQVILRDNSKV